MYTIHMYKCVCVRCECVSDEEIAPAATEEAVCPHMGTPITLGLYFKNSFSSDFFLFVCTGISAGTRLKSYATNI